MNLHEYQARDILRKHGIPVPEGEIEPLAPALAVMTCEFSPTAKSLKDASPVAWVLVAVRVPAVVVNQVGLS